MRVMDMAQFNGLRHALNVSSGDRPLGSAVVSGKRVSMLAVHGRSHRVCGMSSDAMVAYAFGVGPRPGRHRFPFDADDLGACHETLRLAQAFAASGVDGLVLDAVVVERMADVFREFWLRVVAGADPDGRHVENTRWNPLPARNVA